MSQCGLNAGGMAGEEPCGHCAPAEGAASAGAVEFAPAAGKTLPGASSPLGRRGGKCRLSARIIARIPPHVCYCEPFAGGAWVFFKKKPSPVEVLNDIDGELVNFYRVLASFPEYFERKFRFSLYARKELEDLKRADISRMSAEERAWRFFYLNAASYAGDGATFLTSSRLNIGKGYPLTFQHKRRRLLLAHKRLKKAIIENRSWQRILAIYDGPETFFYLDPPYFGHEGDFGKGKFSPGDFAEMAKALATLSGRFILSINDTPETREIFRDFRILDELEAHYSANVFQPKKKRELLLANFQMGEAWPPK